MRSENNCIILLLSDRCFGHYTVYSLFQIEGILHGTLNHTKFWSSVYIVQFHKYRP